MDDNYRHELAALERLAHAEEAERQRVVEVIIRGIGSDYYSAYEEATEAFATYRARFEALERENARLLAVADAAQDYINKRYKKGAVKADSMAALLEALKALE